MACEVLCCGVPQLMDAIVHQPRTGRGRTARRPQCHLDTLFQPALRAAAAAAVSNTGIDGVAGSSPPLPQPYLLGYWCKVTALLAKRRPVAMMRYLDASPGVAAGLTSHTMLAHGSVAALVSTLLDLPWGGMQQVVTTSASTDVSSGLGMSSCHLARGDRLRPRRTSSRNSSEGSGSPFSSSVCEGSLPWLLLRTMATTLTSVPSSSPSSSAASTHACEVLATAWSQAASGCPAAKYASEGYNATRVNLGGRGREEDSDSRAGLLSHEHRWDDGDSNRGAEASSSSPSITDPALSFVNMQLDASFYACDGVLRPADRVHLRMLKLVRDGPLGRQVLVPLAQEAAKGLMAARVSRPQAAPSAAACEAPLRLLAATLESVATAAKHTALYGFPTDDGERQGGGAGCPDLVRAICEPTLSNADEVTDGVVSPLAAWCAVLSAIVNPSASANGASYAASASAASVSPSSAAAAAVSDGGTGTPVMMSLAPSGEGEPPSPGGGGGGGVAGGGSGVSGPSTSTSSPLLSAPSMPGAPVLGTPALALVKALAALVKAAAAAASAGGANGGSSPAHLRGWAAVTSEIVRCGVLPLLCDVMTAFPWHSILHRVVTDALVAVITYCNAGGGAPASSSSSSAHAAMASSSSSSSSAFSSSLIRALLYDARLLSRIVAGCRLAGLPTNLLQPSAGLGPAVSPSASPTSSSSGTSSSTCAAGSRVGYAGHLTRLANALVSAAAPASSSHSPSSSRLPPACTSLLSSHSDWWALLGCELAVYNVAHGLLLGGQLPPDVKASGNVGNAADATGAGGGKGGGAVDEVAALEAKEKEGDDEDGDGGSLSGSDDEDGGSGGGDADDDDNGRPPGGSRRPPSPGSGSDDDGSSDDSSDARSSAGSSGVGGDHDDYQDQEGRATGADARPTSQGYAAQLNEDDEEEGVSYVGGKAAGDNDDDFHASFAFPASDAAADWAPAGSDATSRDDDFDAFGDVAPSFSTQVIDSNTGTADTGTAAADDDGFGFGPGEPNALFAPAPASATQGSNDDADLSFDDFGS